MPGRGPPESRRQERRRKEARALNDTEASGKSSEPRHITSPGPGINQLVLAGPLGQPTSRKTNPQAATAETLTGTRTVRPRKLFLKLPAASTPRNCCHYFLLPLPSAPFSPLTLLRNHNVSAHHGRLCPLSSGRETESQ